MLATSTPAIDALEFDGKSGPGANWQSANEYPALKPESLWSGQDYLRLAWEIIRRSPRYRLYQTRLAHYGLLDQRGFVGGRPVLTDEDFQIPAWRTFPVHQHYCEPRQLDGELLGDYVDRQADGCWKVVHGTWFATKAWGLASLPDPDTRAHDLNLTLLFQPSQAHASAVVDSLEDLSSVGMNAPKVIRRYQAAQEMYVRVRLDLPETDQMLLIQQAITRMRTSLGIDLRKSEVIRQRSTASMSPFWLRVWDAAKTNPKPDASQIKSALRQQIDALNPEIASLVEVKRKRKSSKGTHDPLDSKQDLLSTLPSKVHVPRGEGAHTFEHVVDNWVDTQFDKFRPKARELIEGQRGGTYLADCIAKGLTTPS